MPAAAYRNEFLNLPNKKGNKEQRRAWQHMHFTHGSSPSVTPLALQPRPEQVQGPASCGAPDRCWRCAADGGWQRPGLPPSKESSQPHWSQQDHLSRPRWDLPGLHPFTARHPELRVHHTHPPLISQSLACRRPSPLYKATLSGKVPDGQHWKFIFSKYVENRSPGLDVGLLRSGLFWCRQAMCC